MTGIDNTVLAEALRLLSPYRDQGRVWDTLEELIAAPPAQRGAILRQPRQQEPSTSESTKGRFFNGHNKKSPDLGSTNFAWWPEDDRRYPGQQFEKMLTAQFLWYATHTLSPAQGDRGNAATWTARAPEDAWDVVESVCRKYRVPRQTVSALHAKGGPREWVGEMIRQAKLASANHAVAQKTLAKQQGSQPGAAPSRWDSAYRQPPGAEDDPPYGDLDRPAALLEGRRLDRPHPAFLPWQPPENWDLVGPYSGSLVFADGTFLDLPYLELFGGEAPGEAEFVEGENLLCRLVDTDAHLEQQVTALSYPAALAEEEAAARALGYTHHPPKLWLDHLDYLEDTQAPGKAHLTLYLGSSDYLGHRVYRREMAQNPAAQAAFQETLAGLRGDAEHRLRQCPWASCGGGVAGGPGRERLPLCDPLPAQPPKGGGSGRPAGVWGLWLLRPQRQHPRPGHGPGDPGGAGAPRPQTGGTHPPQPGGGHGAVPPPVLLSLGDGLHPLPSQPVPPQPGSHRRGADHLLCPPGAVGVRGLPPPGRI